MDFKTVIREALARGVDLSKDPIFREAMGGMSVRDVTEALGSDYFPKVTLDAAHNRLMQGYAAVPEDWRKVVNVDTASDFKWQYVTALNGYGNLPKVLPGEKYPFLTPGDGQERWKLDKYGRIFSIDMEAQANDQIGAFGKWSFNEGKAAQRSLNYLVFRTLMHDNPTMYGDSTALFDASSHGNLLTSRTLNYANIKAGYEAMAAQTGRGLETIRIIPRFLLVDPTNWLEALRLTQSNELYQYMQPGATEGETVNYGTFNVFGRGGLGLIPVLCEDIPNGYWYMVADPATCPTWTLGFYKGKQEPEMFREAPNTGGEFYQDSMSFKTRLIAGGVVEDYRGIVRMEE